MHLAHEFCHFPLDQLEKHFYPFLECPKLATESSRYCTSETRIIKRLTICEFKLKFNRERRETLDEDSEKLMELARKYSSPLSQLDIEHCLELGDVLKVQAYLLGVILGKWKNKELSNE